MTDSGFKGDGKGCILVHFILFLRSTDSKVYELNTDVGGYKLRWRLSPLHTLTITTG